MARRIRKSRAKPSKKPFYPRKRRTRQMGMKMSGPHSAGILSVFPPRLVGKVTYERATVISTGTTQNLFGSGTASYWLNSIYNPKTSSGVYNPQGYDQLNGIYGKYKVKGCLVTLTFTNPTQDGIYIGIRAHQAGSSDYIGAELVGTAAMKKWTHVMPINNSGKQVMVYKRYWNIAKMEGLTNLQFASDIDAYTASFQAQPARKPYLEIGACNAVDAVDATVSFTVRLEFICEFYDRKILNNSTVTP